MRLSISNIAWNVDEDETISQILSVNDIDAIDIAPGKYFPDPLNTKKQAILTIKNYWAERGIEITGMQALLFGRKELNVFADADIQRLMLDHLAAICRIGKYLGATRLVFGSPKNRDRTGLSDQQALDQAVSFFRRLGDRASAQEVTICLEPNPVHYGANFMTRSIETAKIVECISHPAIKMQLDTGALALNGEHIDAVLSETCHLIGHIHASEPDLLPLGEGGVDHQKISIALNKYPALPQLICIEMAATKDKPHRVSIEGVLSYAIKNYRKKPDFFS